MAATARFAILNVHLICGACGSAMDSSVSRQDPFEYRAKCYYKPDCPNHGRIFRVCTDSLIELEEIHEEDAPNT